MLVQKDLCIEDFMMDEYVGTVMVVHMDRYNRLMESLLNVYFLDSLYHPINFWLKIKSKKFNFRSSSDLFRKSDSGYVSHPGLHYNQLVKVAVASCKMMYIVVASQPRTNRVHVDMLPSIWITIKYFLIEETNNNKLLKCYDNAFMVHTVKRGLFATPNKRIQCATVEHHTKVHHKVEHMITYI
jgi:hypothetical protein